MAYINGKKILNGVVAYGVQKMPSELTEAEITTHLQNNADTYYQMPTTIGKYQANDIYVYTSSGVFYRYQRSTMEV